MLVDLESGEVVFLDMGMMGHLNSDDRMAIVDLLWAIRAVDAHELASVLIRLSTTFKPFDEQAFREQRIPYHLTGGTSALYETTTSSSPRSETAAKDK